MAAEMKNMLQCAFIYGAACRGSRCPGHLGIHAGGRKVSSMMADNAAIVSSSPHLLQGGWRYSGRHVHRLPAVRFLVTKDVFHAPTNSLSFLCCSLSSVFLLELSLPSLIVLFSVVSVTLCSSSLSLTWKTSFCQSAEASVQGGPGTCWKNTAPPRWEQCFQRKMHNAV